MSGQTVTTYTWCERCHALVIDFKRHMRAHITVESTIARSVTPGAEG